MLEVGGTISGEHGDGLSRSWFVPQQFGPLYDVFRQIKRIFDRQNILNPGKKVADAPQPLTANLRTVVARQTMVGAGGETEPGQMTAAAAPIALQLAWKTATVDYTRARATAADVAARSCPTRACVPFFVTVRAKRPRRAPRPI